MKKRKILSTLKKGALSKEEKANIEDWVNDKDEVDIARDLNRSLAQVQKYKAEYLSGAPKLVQKRSEAEELRRELHANSQWPRIKDEFSDRELKYYENSYIDYRRQFKDLTPTEFKQLYQLITADIFMHRQNIDRTRLIQEADYLEDEIEQEKKATTPDEKKLANRIEKLKIARSALRNISDDYKQNLENSKALMREMKATRDQRIKSYESQGKFMDVLRQLEMKDKRQGVSEISGLMDLAIEKEKERLMKPHMFKDGQVDYPVLNSETPFVENIDDKKEEMLNG